MRGKKAKELRRKMNKFFDKCERENIVVPEKVRKYYYRRLKKKESS